MTEIGQGWTVAAHDEAMLNNCVGRDAAVVRLIDGGQPQGPGGHQGILHYSGCASLEGARIGLNIRRRLY